MICNLWQNLSLSSAGMTSRSATCEFFMSFNPNVGKSFGLSYEQRQEHLAFFIIFFLGRRLAVPTFPLLQVLLPHFSSKLPVLFPTQIKEFKVIPWFISRYRTVSNSKPHQITSFHSRLSPKAGLLYMALPNFGRVSSEIESTHITLTEDTKSPILLFKIRVMSLCWFIVCFYGVLWDLLSLSLSLSLYIYIS